jgi:hypothetical protein
VVTEGHGVEAQLVEGLADLFGAVEGVVERALELVAGVQPEGAVVLGAELVDGMLDASVAAEAAALGVNAVGARGVVLVQVGMDVVDVEEGWSGQYVKQWVRPGKEADIHMS